MKVLVVGTGGEIVSGISVAADQMVRTLEELGLEVTRLEAGVRRRSRPGSPTLGNAAAAISDAVRVWRATRRTDADVVWYHTFGLPALPATRALLVALAARIAGARTITHIHAFGLEDWLARAGITLRLALGGLGLMSDRIIVLYPAAEEALRSRTRVRHLSVMQNWVDVPGSLAPLPPDRPFILCFVGGLIERKGIYELLDTIRLLDEEGVQLRLVGSAREDGPEAQRALEQSASDLVSAGHVTFRGELSPEDVRNELRAAHAFVLPTNAEGLPLAMLEAMAEGRPVIVGDAGDIRRTVGEAGAGVVLPDTSPEAVAKAVRALLTKEDVLVEMGMRGHRYVHDTANRAEGRVMEVLRTAMAGPPGRTSDA